MDVSKYASYENEIKSQDQACLNCFLAQRKLYEGQKIKDILVKLPLISVISSENHSGLIKDFDVSSKRQNNGGELEGLT